MLVAVAGGMGPGILAALLSAAFTGIFLIEPKGQFSIANASDAAGLIVFLSMGILISVMAGALHRLKDRERKRVEQALRDSEDRFRQVVEGVEDYAIIMLDTQGGVASWNAGAQRIKGWSESEILGEDFSRFFPPEAVSSGRPRQLLEIAAAGGHFREEAERVRKDGSRFWADVSVTALRDEHGALRGYTKVTRDISERKRATRVLAEGRSRLASVVESAMDAIITIDADHNVVLFNAAAEAMFGCPAAEAMGRPLEQFIPQRFRQAHVRHVRGFAETGVTSRAMQQPGTLNGLKRNGEEFPIEASISQATVDGSKLFTVILRDITLRKHAEEHQSLLLGELAHRVKNTLAVVQSLAVQTRRFATAEQFHDTFTGRLSALANAHDLLTRSEWEGASLADVVRFGLEPYAGGGIVTRFAIAGPDIWLAPNEAVTLSLAFHELATNAARYGALSNGCGRIDVRWALEPEGQPAAVTICWREHGGPEICPPSRRGFGSRLLERAITHELGGQTEMTFTPSGAGCTFRIPLSPRIRMHP
jgi:PAS domain S-box-containing protein